MTNNANATVKLHKTDYESTIYLISLTNADIKLMKYKFQRRLNYIVKN